MTLPEAFQKLAYSEQYKSRCQGSNKYTVYRNRMARKKLGTAAMAKTLQEFGFEIRADGMPLDYALLNAMSRPDYFDRWHGTHKSMFLRGALGIGGKIATLEVFGYRIEVCEPANNRLC